MGIPAIVEEEDIQVFVEEEGNQVFVEALVWDIARKQLDEKAAPLMYIQGARRLHVRDE